MADIVRETIMGTAPINLGQLRPSLDQGRVITLHRRMEAMMKGRAAGQGLTSALREET